MGHDSAQDGGPEFTVRAGSMIHCRDCGAVIRSGQEVHELLDGYCPLCMKGQHRSLICERCGSSICPECGGVLELAGELGMG